MRFHLRFLALLAFLVLPIGCTTATAPVAEPPHSMLRLSRLSYNQRFQTWELWFRYFDRTPDGVEYEHTETDDFGGSAVWTNYSAGGRFLDAHVTNARTGRQAVSFTLGGYDPDVPGYHFSWSSSPGDAWAVTLEAYPALDLGRPANERSAVARLESTVSLASALPHTTIGTFVRPRVTFTQLQQLQPHSAASPARNR
jgi:hypothetical protein